jgi:ribosomal protein L37AE/L43A
MKRNARTGEPHATPVTPKPPRCPTCNSANTVPVIERFGEETWFCGACEASWSVPLSTTREPNRR